MKSVKAKKRNRGIVGQMATGNRSWKPGIVSELMNVIYYGDIY